VETIISLAALIVLLGALSTLAARLLTRKGGALWVWDHSSVLGWVFIVAGAGLVVTAFLLDQPGLAMSTKLGLGSLLLAAGLWMIW